MEHIIALFFDFIHRVIHVAHVEHPEVAWLPAPAGIKCGPVEYDGTLFGKHIRNGRIEFFLITVRLIKEVCH
jgi:hypothetical protein